MILNLREFMMMITTNLFRTCLKIKKAADRRSPERKNSELKSVSMLEAAL